MPERFNRDRVAKQDAAQAAAAPMQDYEITDPHHRPDLNGEFAGAKVQMRGGKQVVRLTDAAAQFYIDQAVLQPLNKPAAAPPSKPAA